MTPQDKIKELAEMDGWTEVVQASLDCWEALSPKDRPLHEEGHMEMPNYLESYDAIIPLIQKQTEHIKNEVENCIEDINASCFWYNVTPAELSDALLIATGRMKG